MKKIIIVAGALLMIGAAGCYNDKYDQLYVTPSTVTCDTTSVSFAADVLPILNANCNVSGGCHDASGSAVSGFNFTTYAGVQTEATANIMVNDINGTPASRNHAMPLNLPKIAQCDINKITAWINQGAQNN